MNGRCNLSTKPLENFGKLRIYKQGAFLLADYATGAFDFMDQGASAGGGEPGRKVFDELTAKQREVLDLLIQHKTSKEISRALGISPYTVDQRINLARAKLGLANRNEVAHVYRQLVSTYQQPVYEPSYIAPSPFSVDRQRRDDMEVETLSKVPQLASAAHAITPAYGRIAATAGGGPAADYYHVLPEMFDGPYGTVLRLGYMTGIALFLMLVALGGMAMFSQLGVMMDH
ncbi:helix-turn-helix transcriptional regulator [Novosphingobium sp.]|uniref:helix-turn-helix transcriptional regulator n=1 Tax=Novosphingobium sp. TaxID=1874826 RepID=UPI0025EB5829|nr:helix-turn-helix transcriptional regulator [Novosphingobium sp.]